MYPTYPTRHHLGAWEHLGARAKDDVILLIPDGLLFGLRKANMEHGLRRFADCFRNIVLNSD